MSALYYTLDNMKQPATILVLPVLYQNLPVSAILVQILVNSSIPVSSSICNTRRYWSLPKYEYCRYRKILGNTGYTSIADTGRFWKILVIPVLQILEDSRKYWSYQYCRYWKILENTGNTSIADTDIGRLGRIPVNPSFYVYIILKELNIFHTHTSFLLYIS